MKTIVIIAAILFSPVLLTAQQAPEWQRVYTFDESVIDIHSTDMFFTGPHTGRVKFQWSFDTPQTLNVNPRIKYQSRQEVIEFDCSAKRFRLISVTLLDAAGKVVRPEEVNPSGQWGKVGSTIMMEKLYSPACHLMELRKHPLILSSEAIEKKKVEDFAASFALRLEEKKDITPLIKEFFAPDFLSGYLRDKDRNWLLVLNRDVAAKVPRAELQRYYAALMNTAYLSTLYFNSQSPSDEDERPLDEKMIPPGMVNLLRNHPYFSAHTDANGNDDALAGKIESPERLRRYTDLMEKIVALFRQRVREIWAKKNEEYFRALNEMGEPFSNPQSVTCRQECFGLPAGTRLFQVAVPAFDLQLAEINGALKIVSATPMYQ